MEKEQISAWFKSLQHEICGELSRLDQSLEIKIDLWQRDGGGGGDTRVLSGGVIEKGGVNFSAVHGKTPQKILDALKLQESRFYATGISIVLHPVNPHAPIIHMNLRYFEMSTGESWFGGGIDLTPHYVDQKRAGIFHQRLKAICDRHDAGYYPEFKKWADEYFFIKHRNETRGVGGIFFDRLSENETTSRSKIFSFVQEVGKGFIPIYSEAIRGLEQKPFGEPEKRWQALRRGRYVEFNLVWDKGTKFGLDTNGRTESILMSLPPQADWTYNYTPEPGSREEQTLAMLKKNIDWLKFYRP